MGKNTFHTLAAIFVLVASTTFFGFKKSADTFKLPKSVKKQFAFIAGGDTQIEEEKVQVGTFFISKYEVSNADYTAFLHSLIEQGDLKTYQLAQIDTANWTSAFKNKHMAPFTKYYHSHEAYKNYPVVNITREGAEAYCKWLTAQLNEENSSSAYSVEVRLPSRNEWIYASSSGFDKAVYSWGGPYLRNSRGQLLCNYKYVGDENIFYNDNTDNYEVTDPYTHIGVAGRLNNSADVTAPVNAYPATNFGLYNMNGNVAELVTEGVACGGSWKSTGFDVRNVSTMNYEGASCQIGFRPILAFSKK